MESRRGPQRLAQQPALIRDAVEAAQKLRRFMDAYFTEDNITDAAGDVLGETGWIDR